MPLPVGAQSEISTLTLSGIDRLGVFALGALFFAVFLDFLAVFFAVDFVVDTFFLFAIIELP